MSRRIGAEFTLQTHIPIHVHPFEMYRIDRILLRLIPVARNFRENNLPESVLPCKWFPIWHERGRGRPQISPDQTRLDFDRIRLNVNFILEACCRRGGVVVRLLKALSAFIEQPAVIIAPQTTLLHETV